MVSSVCCRNALMPAAALLAMQKTYAHLQNQGSLAGIEGALMGFADRQAAVDVARWSALEQRFASR